MQYMIPEEINKQPKIFKMLFYKDIVYVLLYMTVAWRISSRLSEHVAVLIIYYVFSLFIAVYLVAPSADNPLKRHYHSIYYAFKQDTQTYHSLCLDDMKGADDPLRKRKVPKLGKKTLDIMPFYDITENGLFLTEDGLVDIIRIRGQNILNSFRYEQEQAIDQLAYFFRVYKPDCKLVCMSFPTNTEKQQEFINRKIDATENPVHQYYLHQELSMLQSIQKDRYDLEFYLFVFGKNEKQYNECISTISRILPNIVEPLDVEKKKNIIRKLANMNSKIKV